MPNRQGVNQPLSRPRAWLIHRVIGLVIVGSGVCIVTGREYWPFSPYAMFSTLVNLGGNKAIRAYGVPTDTERSEFALRGFHMRPFGLSGVRRALKRLSRRPDSDRLWRTELRDVHARYERLRRAGRHHAPPLQSLRLYQLEWKSRDWTALSDKPDKQILLMEVRL